MSILMVKCCFLYPIRPGTFKVKTGENSHDIFLGIKRQKYDAGFFQVNNLDPPGESNAGLNSNFNEGAVSISSDMKILYFTACDRSYGYGDCDIYSAEVNITPFEIQILSMYNLGSIINTRYWETMPSISPDNLRLYFVSNRPEGEFSHDPNFMTMREKDERMANFNIWYSDFDTINRFWMKPKKLSPVINTIGKEYSPYIAADNKTLFFASNRHEPNYGGLDLFYSRRDSNDNWTEPVNLGEPLNSDENEFCISIVRTGDVIYFTSTRGDIPNCQGGYDILMAFVPPILDDARIVAWHQYDTADVVINIYDEEGSEINSLKYIGQTPGRHSIVWDGADSSGKACPSGIYYYETIINNGMPEQPRVLIVK